MSNSPSQMPVFIHPAIKSLNVRQISKIIASKIIKNTSLQFDFNSAFCKQLSVSMHLNTYEAVAYFTDNQYFEIFGFNRHEIFSFHEVYEELYFEFKQKICLDKD